jgi:transmembrane sensor
MNTTQQGHFREAGPQSTEEKILTRAGHFRVPPMRSKEEAFELLKVRMMESPARRTVTFPANLRQALAAAAGLALVVAGIWLYQARVSGSAVVAQRGHRLEYQLPDGSSVALNADTRITFRKGSFNRKRTLTMDGQAFFTVGKGSSFTVKTGLGNVLVLGTSFDVFARDDQFRVSCFTGRVRVSAASRSVILMPGETAELAGGKLVRKASSDISTVAGWRMGSFSFENTPLARVFEELERQFNITFVLPGISDKSFTGTLSDGNLVDALDIVCIPMGLTYEIGSNSQVIIKYKTD